MACGSRAANGTCGVSIPGSPMRIANGRLTARGAFITAENINELMGTWGTGEIDLLSIDIDGNDFHVWQTIRAVKPRVVVIEFNAKFPPPLAIVQEYRADNRWKRTD